MLSGFNLPSREISVGLMQAVTESLLGNFETYLLNNQLDRLKTCRIKLRKLGGYLAFMQASGEASYCAELDSCISNLMQQKKTGLGENGLEPIVAGLFNLVNLSNTVSPKKFRSDRARLISPVRLNTKTRTREGNPEKPSRTKNISNQPPLSVKDRSAIYTMRLSLLSLVLDKLEMFQIRLGNQQICSNTTMGAEVGEIASVLQILNLCVEHKRFSNLQQYLTNRCHGTIPKSIYSNICKAILLLQAHCQDLMDALRDRFNYTTSQCSYMIREAQAVLVAQLDSQLKLVAQGIESGQHYSLLNAAYQLLEFSEEMRTLVIFQDRQANAELTKLTVRAGRLILVQQKNLNNLNPQLNHLLQIVILLNQFVLKTAPKIDLQSSSNDLQEEIRKQSQSLIEIENSVYAEILDQAGPILDYPDKLMQCFHADSISILHKVDNIISNFSDRGSDSDVAGQLYTCFYKLALNLKTINFMDCLELVQSFQFVFRNLQGEKSTECENVPSLLREFLSLFEIRLSGSSRTPVVEKVSELDPEKNSEIEIESSPEEALVNAAVAWEVKTWFNSFGRQHEVVINNSETNEQKLSVELAPVHLVGNIPFLLELEKTLATSSGKVDKENIELVQLMNTANLELKMLVKGAQLLRFYRLETLCTVLLEVQQTFSVNVSTIDCPNAISILLEAHRMLGKMLNQAASSQQLDSGKEIIAHLYDWLDSGTHSHTHPHGSNQNAYGQVHQQLPRHSQVSAEEMELYFSEAGQLLQSISTGIEILKKKVDSQCINEVLSALHTLKGNSRLFQFQPLATYCHELENYFLELTLRDDIGRGTGSNEKLVEELSSVLVRLQFEFDEVCRQSDQCEAHSPEQIGSSSEGQQKSTQIPDQSLQRICELVARNKIIAESVIHLLPALTEQGDQLVKPVEKVELVNELLHEQIINTGQIEEEIRGSRVVCFARYTPRLKRLVGMIGNELDKQVDFSVTNDLTAGDRYVLERLIVPLEHLLRNAIDHGIEELSLRHKRGKSAVARLCLKLQINLHELVFTLVDDGSGIDASKIARLVRHNELIKAPATESEQHLLPEKEVLQWIFLSGLTTAKRVNQHSGRGLGLFIVATQIENLGGTIVVSSVLNVGTKFVIRVPHNLN